MSLTYRDVRESDRPILSDWIQQDPDHKDRCNADFWLNSEKPRYESFAVEDELGTVFYVRGERVYRLHVQFCPLYGQTDRVRAALSQFCDDVKKTARKNFTQVIIETVFRPLALFLLKQGMKRSKNEMIFDLKDSN